MNKPNLDNVSTKELRAALAARELAEKKEAARKRNEFLRLLVANKPALLPLMEHDRTSCSDENPANGLGSAENGVGARCMKCGLITLEEFSDVDVSLSLEFRFKAYEPDPEFG